MCMYVYVCITSVPTVLCLQRLSLSVQTNNLAHENCGSVIWKKIMFLGGASCEVLTAVLWESRTQKLCSCQLFIQSILHNLLDLIQWWILEYLASEIFVLASESNLSLSTGLASWKVSLNSWVYWKWLLQQPANLYSKIYWVRLHCISVVYICFTLSAI